jgi:hypothetical protein
MVDRVKGLGDTRWGEGGFMDGTSKFKTGVVHYAAAVVAMALAVGSVALHKDRFFPGVGDGAGGGGGAAAGVAGARGGLDDFARDRSYAERVVPRVAFERGQRILSTLVLDGDWTDEQVVAFQSATTFEDRVFLTQIKFDTASGEYARVMTEGVAANVADTVSLQSNDLVGDRSVCILLSGMNTAGEHTLAVFRKPDNNGVFAKIGEFVVDGIISVVETERGVNYERGVTNGASFAITTRGRDTASLNEMDQVEVVYTYDPALNRYAQSGITAIPGAAIDVQRQRELLSGDKARFQEFISGLWYPVGADGAVDTRLYVYIDAEKREIIFFSEDRQEVFSWINTTSTRYGLYLVANNSAVTTLRRYIDVEMETLDRIRLKVVEDVRMKIEVSAPWDGAYRKAPPLQDRKDRVTGDLPPVTAFVEAEYESSLGRVGFAANGAYRIETDSAARTGKYAFFRLGTEELLELRPAARSAAERVPREVYAVARDDSGLVLFRVRIGAKQIERYPEASIALYARK